MADPNRSGGCRRRNVKAGGVASARWGILPENKASE